MQGACVYRSSNNEPTLIMYKELFTTPGKAIFVIYRNNKLVKTRLTTRELSNIIPPNSVDILTRLPYHENTDQMIQIWYHIIKNTLINSLNQTF